MFSNTSHMSGWTETGQSPLAQRQCLTKCTPQICGVNSKLQFTAREEMIDAGYVAIPQATMSRATFAGIYGVLDEFFYAEGTQRARDLLGEAASMWNNDDANSAAYSGAPVGMVNRLTRADKDDKVYLQLCREFGHYLKGQKGSPYHYCSTVRFLIDTVMQLADQSEAVFRAMIARLLPKEQASIGATGMMKGNLPIMVKFLSYHPSDRWATPPHYDKSLFTAVLNGDDIWADTFRIGPKASGALDLTNLSAPPRFVEDPSEDGTMIVFPGMFTKHVGMPDIPPSPHGVVPVAGGRLRHSAIAFLLVPNLNTSGLITTITDL